MGGGAINIFFFQGRLLETIDYDDPILNAQNRQTTIWILKMARIGL